MHPAPAKKNDPLFRVEFIGGLVVIAKAPNSLKAEQQARRDHPGIVARVRILKGTRR